MIDRAEAQGLGAALAGHLALFGALSLGLAGARLPPLAADPIEVSLVDIGLLSSSPAPAAAAAAPELGMIDEAPPPAPQPEPVPVAAQPPPAPSPAPARPVPPPQATPVKAKAAAALPSRNPGATPKAKAATPRATRIDRDFLKGLGDPAATGPAPAATMSADALAGIKAAIERQIQPCADRQVDPGPGANQIRVTLNLRLNRDGSLARPPSVVRTAGVSAANGRYEARVRDLAVAAYSGCAPLTGLPLALYRTETGGWSNLNMTYRLP